MFQPKIIVGILSLTGVSLGSGVYYQMSSMTDTQKPIASPNSSNDNKNIENPPEGELPDKNDATTKEQTKEVVSPTPVTKEVIIKDAVHTTEDTSKNVSTTVSTVENPIQPSEKETQDVHETKSTDAPDNITNPKVSVNGDDDSSNEPEVQTNSEHVEEDLHVISQTQDSTPTVQPIVIAPIIYKTSSNAFHYVCKTARVDQCQNSPYNTGAKEFNEYLAQYPEAKLQEISPREESVNNMNFNYCVYKPETTTTATINHKNFCIKLKTFITDPKNTILDIFNVLGKSFDENEMYSFTHQTQHTMKGIMNYGINKIANLDEHMDWEDVPEECRSVNRSYRVGCEEVYARFKVPQQQ